LDTQSIHSKQIGQVVRFQSPMLYLALRHSHIGLSGLAMLATLAWVIAAWKNPIPATGRLPTWLRAIYIVNRATVGLAGITGLWLTLIGPWRIFLFPYLGLLGFIVLELAAAFSKRTWLSGSGHHRALLCAQVLCILGISGLMSAKII